MSKILELVDIGRFSASKLTYDNNNYEIVDMELVKLNVATNPHTNLMGVRRNRQCQGFRIHLHRLNPASPLLAAPLPLSSRFLTILGFTPGYNSLADAIA